MSSNSILSLRSLPGRYITIRNRAYVVPIRQSDIWKKKKRQAKKKFPLTQEKKNIHMKKLQVSFYDVVSPSSKIREISVAEKLYNHYQYTSFPPPPFGGEDPKYYEWKQKEMKQAPSSRVKNSFRCKSLYYSNRGSPRAHPFSPLGIMS